MNFFLSFLNAFVNGGSALQTIMTLPLTFALVDFVTGVVSAIKNKQFSLGNLADIFGHASHLIQYVIAMLTLVLTSGLLHWGIDVQTIATTIGSAVLMLTTGRSIVGNVLELFPASVQPLVQELATDIQAGVSDGLTNKVPVFTPDPPTPWSPIPPAPRSSLVVPAPPAPAQPQP